MTKTMTEITTLQQLIDLIATNQTEKINYVFFFNQHIGAEEAKELAEWIKKANLHRIDLRINNIGDEGAKYLADALKEANMSNLHEISLSFNKIGAEGTKYLADALKEANLPNLQTIDLSFNKIGDEGAKYLAEAIKAGKLSNLQTIDLGSDNIGDEGAKYLADALKQGNLPNLQKIDLVKNNIGAEGTKYLAAALKEANLPSLQTINLGFNNIGSEGQDALECIAKILEPNKELIHKIKQATTSKYSHEWDDFSKQEQKALFHFEYAEYLYQEEDMPQAALGQYALAMPVFKSSSRAQLKECKTLSLKSMLQIIRQSGQEPDSLPVFIKECFTGLDIKIFEAFYPSRLNDKTGDENVTEIISSMVLGNNQKSELFFDVLDRLKPQSSESTDVQAVGMDEYKADEF